MAVGLSNGNYTLPENPFKLYQIAPAALYISEQSVEYRGTRALEVSGVPAGVNGGATGANGEALSGGFIVDAEALRSWDTSGSHRFHITFKPESANYVDVTDFVLVTVVRREVRSLSRRKPSRAGHSAQPRRIWGCPPPRPSPQPMERCLRMSPSYGRAITPRH